MAHRSSLSLAVLLPLLLCVAVSASPATYNASQALNQLYLSYSAYCPASKLQNWDCYFCGNVPNFQVVSTIYNSSTNIFAYIGYSGNVGHVVFRGTQLFSLIDWIEDLNFADTTVYNWVPGGLVHSGFFNTWNSIKSQVVAGFQTLVNQHKPTEIYFSGHSLGAALSIFAALEVGATQTIPISVYNFGEPRVGNQIFASYFNTRVGNIWRVVNQDDCVPHLPSMGMGFYHASREVYYTSHSRYRICDASGEDPTCMVLTHSCSIYLSSIMQTTLVSMSWMECSMVAKAEVADAVEDVVCILPIFL